MPLLVDGWAEQSMLRTSPLLSYVMSMPSGSNAAGASAPNTMPVTRRPTSDMRVSRAMHCNTSISSTPVRCV